MSANSGRNGEEFTRSMAVQSEFYKAVYEIVAKVPYGMVTTYGQIAHMLGRPRGARLVGYAMRYCPAGLPWWRVVMKDGSIAGGEYASLRKQYLVDEGVAFTDGGCVDMEKSTWDGDTDLSGFGLLLGKPEA